MRQVLLATTCHPAILVMLMNYALEDERSARTIVAEVRTGELVVMSSTEARRVR